MNLIIGIIVGMFAWQFITFLTAIVTNQDEMPVLMMGTGMFGIITRMVSKIIYKMKQTKRFHGTRSLIIDSCGNIFNCDPSKASKLVGNGYEFVNYNEKLKDKFPKELWKAEFRNSGEISPNVRYCPKEVWMKFASIV